MLLVLGEPMNEVSAVSRAGSMETMPQIEMPGAPKMSAGSDSGFWPGIQSYQSRKWPVRMAYWFRRWFANLQVRFESSARFPTAQFDLIRFDQWPALDSVLQGFNVRVSSNEGDRIFEYV